MGQEEERSKEMSEAIGGISIKKAWQLLYQRIEAKTSWGKIELQKLMLQCLIDAGEREEK